MWNRFTWQAWCTAVCFHLSALHGGATAQDLQPPDLDRSKVAVTGLLDMETANAIADIYENLADVTGVTPVERNSLLQAAQMTRTNARNGRIRVACFKKDEQGTAAITLPDKIDPLTGSRSYNRDPDNGIIINKEYAEEYALASILFHELVHAIQTEPQPELPKNRANMEYEAYCIQIRFAEILLRYGQATQRLTPQRVGAQTLILAIRAKEKEEQKLC